MPLKRRIVLLVWLGVSSICLASDMAVVPFQNDGVPAGWVVTAVIPLLVWSRLVLGRHTPIEVTLGLFFGILAGIASYVW